MPLYTYKLILGLLPLQIVKMADITNVFKATVKAVRSRSKAVGDGSAGDSVTNILPTSKNRGEFETKARDVV